MVAWRHYFLSKFPELDVICFTSYPKLEEGSQAAKEGGASAHTFKHTCAHNIQTQHTNTFTHSTYMHAHVHTHILTHAHIHSTHTYIQHIAHTFTQHTHIHTAHTHTYTCTHIHVHTRMHTHTCTFTHVHTYILTHTYAHTHTLATVHCQTLLSLVRLRSRGHKGKRRSAVGPEELFKVIESLYRDRGVCVEVCVSRCVCVLYPCVVQFCTKWFNNMRCIDALLWCLPMEEGWGTSGHSILQSGMCF